MFRKGGILLPRLLACPILIPRDTPSRIFEDARLLVHQRGTHRAFVGSFPQYLREGGLLGTRENQERTWSSLHRRMLQSQYSSCSSSPGSMPRQIATRPTA